MRRILLSAVVWTVWIGLASGQEGVTKYVRYSHEGRTSYGILEGGTIRELAGDLFSSPRKTGKTVSLADVVLLVPCEPSKVIAVGLNYKSHLGERPEPEYPGLFAKFPTSLAAHGEDIVIPPGSDNIHYEGELVVIIGKTAKNVSVADAPKHIFGVTAGNDVSERDWQRADLQWIRAKASDTFGPVGPAIVSGLDYKDLLVQTRLNGEVCQKESSKDLLHDVDQIVSYISKYITLLPGDMIFTGTPGSTKPMKPGDVVEVEVEGVGILRNTIVAAK
jgi:2-keto-4-pentenoate hydratase/2-oxohepta-3-ene-1,7-dioic acid hydratase in catechol pathway